MAADVRRKRVMDDALAREIGARAREALRAEAAEARAARASWWAQYGVWVGVGGTVALELLTLGLLMLVIR